MDARLKSVTLLILILLAVSEARPLLSPLQGKEGIIGEVNGVFRTLKGAGPSPGVGHRLKKLQNLRGKKDFGGPSSGGVGHRLQNLEGHRVNTLQVLGVSKRSGPSPGEGHKHITSNHS